MVFNPIKSKDNFGCSWEVSHLPALSQNEKRTFLNMLPSWLEGKKWSIESSCDASLLWEYALRHGLGGIIGSLVADGKMDHPEMKDWAKKWYLSALLYYEQSLVLCRRLQCVARDMEIPIVFIKGPAIAFQAYPQPAVRSYSDIDVIISSQAEALKIGEVLTNVHFEPSPDSKLNRLIHPGRIHARMGEWEIEFCYPVNPSPDPAFDMIQRHSGRILKMTPEETPFPIPDPSFHMVFLIQHMARHLCCRVIWFLDLVALNKKNRDQLDWPWIIKELDSLQLRNISSRISFFCRNFMDRDFPLISSKREGWNTGFQKSITSFDQIHGMNSLFHAKGGWLRFHSIVLSALRYYLITDPRPREGLPGFIACRWLSARVLNSLNFPQPFYISCLAAVFQYLFFLLFPLVWFLSYSVILYRKIVLPQTEEK